MSPLIGVSLKANCSSRNISICVSFYVFLRRTVFAADRPVVFEETYCSCFGAVVACNASTGWCHRRWCSGGAPHGAPQGPRIVVNRGYLPLRVFASPSDLPSFPSERKGIHLIVFVHGFQGQRRRNWCLFSVSFLSLYSPLSVPLLFYFPSVSLLSLFCLPLFCLFSVSLLCLSFVSPFPVSCLLSFSVSVLLSPSACVLSLSLSVCLSPFCLVLCLSPSPFDVSCICMSPRVSRSVSRHPLAFSLPCLSLSLSVSSCGCLRCRDAQTEPKRRGCLLFVSLSVSFSVSFCLF